jgi:hypothetical protein
MTPVTSHRDAVDVAYVHVLHTFIDETGKADAYHTSDIERGYESPSTQGSGTLVDSTQTLEAVDPDFLPTHIVNGLADRENICPGTLRPVWLFLDIDFVSHHVLIHHNILSAWLVIPHSVLRFCGETTFSSNESLSSHLLSPC